MVSTGKEGDGSKGKNVKGLLARHQGLHSCWPGAEGSKEMMLEECIGWMCGAWNFRLNSWFVFSGSWRGPKALMIELNLCSRENNEHCAVHTGQGRRETRRPVF